MSIFTPFAHGDIHAFLYSGLAAIPACHFIRAVRAKRYGAAGENATVGLIHILLACFSGN
jgi:hypothetical protein